MTGENTNHHTPVLLKEVDSFLELNITNESRTKLFDGTLGGGGYSFNFLKKGWEVYSCDLDSEAISKFKYKIESEKIPLENSHLTNSNFSKYIQEFEPNFFDGIVLDLGFSSNQLESSQRGFSYLKPDDYLDLRYDFGSLKPCWKMLYETRSAENLGKILFTYSGEELSFRIARSLISLIDAKKLESELKQDPIKVSEVVKAIEQAIPAKFRPKRNAILSRTWQALRIWTNKEFENLELFLSFSLSKLRLGGKLAVVSFHSLEDKIVTKFMRKASILMEVDDFGNKKSDYKVLTNKAVLPSPEEVSNNPRSRSAMLRVIEKKV